nr:uncharacterized protein LOC107442546 [Parasteatoda tepidariorum]
MNLQKLEVTLSDLNHGIPYYIRVAAGNSKGYSPYSTPEQPSATPSSWMDVNGKKSRSHGRLCELDSVFHQIIFTREPGSPEITDIPFGNVLGTPRQQRKQSRMSIRNLFTPTPKFQKYLERGVYLACLIYTDHRLLVTAEDTLPIMEVDENCPSCLNSDFHWLMKVACTWEDTRALRLEMEKTQSSSSFHFRSKLLQAAEMMQAALGIQDLGQFYCKPIKNMDDTTVLCTVKYIPDSKNFNTMSLRWVPVTKLQRKLSVNVLPIQDFYTTNSKLLSTTQAMMTYNHVSKIPLSRGLYVAYVKISSSVDLIRILVPKKAPNILPYYKVRDNPHVSSEEWIWLKSKATNGIRDLTLRQLKFQKVLSSAVRNLLKILDVPSDQTDDHRLFDNEVIELNSDVSLLLLLPPVNSVCAAPGQKDCITERKDCVLLPLQIFEIIHMSTYQPKFISRYSRVSSLLEINTTNAQHVLREAFSVTEVASAKSRLKQLQQFQTQVDTTWRSMRWLMDVLNFARDRNTSGGILLSNFVNEKPDSPSTESPVHSPKHFLSTYSLQEQATFPQTDNPYPAHFNYSTNYLPCSSSAYFPRNSADSPDMSAFAMQRCSSISKLTVISESSKTFPSNSPQSFQPSTKETKSQKNLTLPRNYKIDTTSYALPDVTNDSFYFPIATASSDSGNMSQFTVSDTRSCLSVPESIVNDDSSKTNLINSAQWYQSPMRQTRYQKNLTLPRNYKIDSTPNKTNSDKHVTNGLPNIPLSNDLGDLPQFTDSKVHTCSSKMNDDSNTSIPHSAQSLQSSICQSKYHKNLTLPRNYKTDSTPNKTVLTNDITNDSGYFHSLNVSNDSDMSQFTTSDVRRCSSMSESVMNDYSNTSIPYSTQSLQSSICQSKYHKNLTLPRNYKIDDSTPHKTLLTNHITNDSDYFPSVNEPNDSDMSQFTTSAVHGFSSGSESTINVDHSNKSVRLCSAGSVQRFNSQKNLTLPKNYKIESLPDKHSPHSHGFKNLPYFPSPNVSNDLNHNTKFELDKSSLMSGSMEDKDASKATPFSTSKWLQPSVNGYFYEALTLPRNYKINSLMSLVNHAYLVENKSNDSSGSISSTEFKMH